MSNIRIDGARPADAIANQAPVAGSNNEHASLVPDPTPMLVSDDAIAALAKLLAEMDQQDRASARKAGAADDQAQAREDAAEVQAMHDKADHIRAEGIATGIAEIGAGLAEFGASRATEGKHKMLAAVLTGAQRGSDVGSPGTELEFAL